MKRENLRKVKWFLCIEYFYGDKKLTEEQAFKYEHIDGCLDDGSFRGDLIKAIGEKNFKEIEPVRVYEYGYFHQWVVENYGNTHEGLSTYVYALIETENGEILKFNYDRFVFIN